MRHFVRTIEKVKRKFCKHLKTLNVINYIIEKWSHIMQNNNRIRHSE